MAAPSHDIVVHKESKTREELRFPPKFNVVAFNDNVTSMDCVVGILKDVFNKSTEDAISVMMKIHTEGKGICGGTYSRDIAETKAQQAIGYARKQGFPLRVEPQEA